jgi:ParB family transcriptional regulator, chromosome partitioning protein
MSEENGQPIQMIPIDRITIVNRRGRGRIKFRQIMANIAKIGLKRPITLARRKSQDGQPRYDLVCGQGRLETYIAHGQSEVPAIVIEASESDVLLMSLVENLARRRQFGLELLREIGAMKERGHSPAEIAELTDLDVGYVRGVIRLLNKADEGLLRAVDSGQIPVSVAITIASSDDEAVQRALAEAYENNSLRGKALLKARRLIETRRREGRVGKTSGVKTGHNGNGLSADQLMKTYQRESTRQRLVVGKAKLCETRLLFIVSAFRSLRKDEDFINLLRAEKLDSMPQFLADQVNGKAH